MKNRSRLIVSAFTFFAIACLNGCTNGRSADETPDGVPATQELQREAIGTGDSGGGNLFKGQPLESYIQQPVFTSAYIRHLSEMMMNIDKAHPTLARLLMHGLVTKPWYFVPAELKELPEDRLGSAVPTDQVALQTFEEVWINRLLFDQMSSQNQAKLILHEAFMGLRLLKFESLYNQCLATTARRDFCQGLSELRPETPVSLTPKDYSDIRRATDEFSRFGNALPSQWMFLEGTMEKYGFGFPFREFQDFYSALHSVPLIDVVGWLDRSLISPRPLTYGFANPVAQSETCSFLYSLDGTRLEFVVSGQDREFRLKGDFAIAGQMLPFAVDLESGSDWHKVILIDRNPASTPRWGLILTRGRSAEIVASSVHKMECRAQSASGACGEWVLKREPEYACSAIDRWPLEAVR